MAMEGYKVGVCRLDITPFLNVPIIGLVADRGVSDYLDPLFVNTIAFEGEGKKLLWFVLDHSLIGMPECKEWPKRLAADLGLPEDCINISCVHAHTAPCLGSGADDYDAFVYRRLVDAATLAFKDAKPVVDVQWAEDKAEGLAYTRRYRMQDGTVETNPVRAERKMVGYAAPFDDTMRIVRILRENAKEVVLVNFQAHPDNIGFPCYSSDYPSMMNANFENARKDTFCMFFNGAEGDMISRGSEPFAQDLESKYAWTINYAKDLADFALKLHEKTVSTKMAGFSYKKETTQVKTKLDLSRMDEAKRIYNLFMEGKYEQVHPNMRYARYYAAESRQLINLAEKQKYETDVVINSLTFCGATFVGISAEPFSEVGVKIRQASQYPVTCVVCMTNGCSGYLPTIEAFEQGGYETFNTSVAKGAAEKITEEAIRLVAAL